MVPGLGAMVLRCWVPKCPGATCQVPRCWVPRCQVPRGWCWCLVPRASVPVWMSRRHVGTSAPAHTARRTLHVAP